MKIKKDTPVRLKTFLGTLISNEEVNSSDNYWKLIGEKGKIIDCDETVGGRVLVLFDKNLDSLKLENHNPIKNTLWIKKSDLELDNYRIHLKKIENKILELTSFMNNTKWFKLFTEIKNKEIKIESSKIKFISDDREYNFRIIGDGFDSNGFGDVSELGPFLFKEIEWILIPKKHEIERWNREEKLTSEFFIQPIDKIKSAMEMLGDFEYDITEGELKIYGYK